MVWNCRPTSRCRNCCSLIGPGTCGSRPHTTRDPNDQTRELESGAGRDMRDIFIAAAAGDTVTLRHLPGRDGANPARSGGERLSRSRPRRDGKRPGLRSHRAASWKRFARSSSGSSDPSGGGGWRSPPRSRVSRWQRNTARPPGQRRSHAAASGSDGLCAQSHYAVT